MRLSRRMSATLILKAHTPLIVVVLELLNTRPTHYYTIIWWSRTGGVVTTRWDMNVGGVVLPLSRTGIALEDLRFLDLQKRTIASIVPFRFLYAVLSTGP